MQRRQLRIIGGRWRGRRIPLAVTAGIRPTPDRVRETLFNWLQPWIVGTKCLDLFAGAGALGFEASSRGAAHVVMVERDPQVAAMLRQSSAHFDATNITVTCREATAYLRHTKDVFDLVFLDPPFSQGYLDLCIELLQTEGLLESEALIYLEAERALMPPPIPRHWTLLRRQTAGNVGYYLARAAKAF